MKFSFWDNGVSLWDVEPVKNAPTASLLESLRLTLEQDANLKRARMLWWQVMSTVCLDNRQWDPTTESVVTRRAGSRQGVDIVSARFDPVAYRTVLQLQGDLEAVEFAL